MDENLKIITDKIIGDSKARAGDALKDAGAQAAELLGREKEIFESRRRAVLSETEKNADDLVRHRLTIAALDIKKTVLAAQKESVDAAFKNAKRLILEMKDSEYRIFIAKMIKLYASKGDTLVCGVNDSRRINQDFINEVNRILSLDLRLGAPSDEFEGGIKLTSGNYDKNLSLDSLYKELRDEIEPQVNEILFE